MMSPWDRVLERPQARGHFVQLYDSESTALIRNVTRYLCEGVKSGDSMLVIATPEHWELFCRAIELKGFDPASCLRERRIVFQDAGETLSALLVGGQPAWDPFERVIRSALRQLRTPDRGAGFRAYGEMVAILWKSRQFASAVRLEQLWNKLLAQSSFSLYCSYSIDVLGSEFHPDALDAVLSTHTHLLPDQHDRRLESALNRAMTEILGPEGNDLKPLIRATHRPSWAAMPDTEGAILWIRKNLPAHADEIMRRARALFSEMTQDQVQSAQPGGEREIS